MKVKNIKQFPIVTAELAYRDSRSARNLCIEILKESDKAIVDLINEMESTVLPTEKEEIQNMISSHMTNMIFCLEQLSILDSALKRIIPLYN